MYTPRDSIVFNSMYKYHGKAYAWNYVNILTYIHMYMYTYHIFCVDNLHICMTIILNSENVSM